MPGALPVIIRDRNKRGAGARRICRVITDRIAMGMSWGHLTRVENHEQAAGAMSRSSGSARSASARASIAPGAGLIALRLIFGDRVLLDTTTREYFVSRIGGGDRTGHDDIIRSDVALTVRVYRQHAVAVRYLLSRRDAYSTDLGDRSQSSATIGLFYTYLGNDGFGVVDWRDANTR